MATIVVGFCLVLLRTLALVLTAPILGSRAVPIRFRVGIAVVLSAVALPLIRIPAEGLGDVATSGGFASAALSEVVVGVAMGLCVTLMFAVAQMAGSLIGQMAGIQLSDQLDPLSGQAGTPVSQLFAVLSLATFALMNGPELVIGALLQTFVDLPIGTGVLAVGGSLEPTQLSNLLIEILRLSFLLLLRAVAPAVAALMISTLTISIVARSYPQLNLSGLGLSSNVFVMMLSVFLVSGGCVWLFVDDFGSVLELIQTTLTPAAKLAPVGA